MSLAEPPIAAPAMSPEPQGTWSSRTKHPVWLAAGLAAASVVLSVLVALALTRLAPAADPVVARLAAVVVLAVLALVVVGATRGWSRTATRGPASWRRTRLLVVPAAIALAPAVAGFDLPAVGTLAVLVAGYAATGIFEEVWHRGVVLDVLRRLGLRRSVVVGAAFFGAAHLANIAFGQSAAISLAQAVGAFCFGIGFGVLRWRTAAIWPLAAIHAVGDLLFHTTALHGGAFWTVVVSHDILMLLWGLWALRGASDDVTGV